MEFWIFQASGPFEEKIYPHDATSYKLRTGPVRHSLTARQVRKLLAHILNHEDGSFVLTSHAVQRMAEHGHGRLGRNLALGLGVPSA